MRFCLWEILIKQISSVLTMPDSRRHGLIDKMKLTYMGLLHIR